MTVRDHAALLAISLSLLAATAHAQTATPPVPAGQPPVAAGAGAAAAVSGDAAPAATTAETAPAAAGAGAAAAASGTAAPADAAPAAAAAPAPGGATPAAAAGATTLNLPGGPMDLTPDHMENGRWYNAEGIPTFKVENGELDYASFSGYRRYHAECHVCHGPDGEGSTYAPALKDSVTHKIDYYRFQEVVASGLQSTGTGSANQVMPAFGTNRNVWCYVDDIYTYLLAHGTGAIPRGRPALKAKKSDEFAAQEESCMSG